MSKRNMKGVILTEPSTLSMGLECIPLSASQLREMWDYDNQCGSQIMGTPLRTCDCKESSSVQGESSAGISPSELEVLKKTIKEMWNRAKSLFEVFYDDKHPELGYRLRVNECMPIKITMRDEDRFFLGWCAVSPENSPCSHLYNRSPVDPCGYMGGPASYLNWSVGKKATASLSRPTSRLTRYLVRLECKNLTRGQELTWNYGCNKKMPIEADWFKEQCCTVSKPNKNTKRQYKKQTLMPLINVEKCVLCGQQFSINNKECRIQRKSHFINNHADYLGSSWNGLGSYMQEEVDSLSVLKEADKLNSLLQTLSKDLRWNIVPACEVLSIIEKENYADPETLNEFKKRCTLLRSLGTLVMRGLDVAATMEDLSVGHLKPIPTSVWRTLKWKQNVQPSLGLYSVPSQDSEEHTCNVQSFILKFCHEVFLP